MIDERNFGKPSRAGIGLATIRLDGMFFLESWLKDEPGWAVTKPFLFEGSKLELNADASRGSVRVEVLDADSGRPLPGHSAALEGRDGVRLAAGMDLAPLRGKPVRLKFLLLNARLYAFQVRP